MTCLLNRMMLDAKWLISFMVCAVALMPLAEAGLERRLFKGAVALGAVGLGGLSQVLPALAMQNVWSRGHFGGRHRHHYEGPGFGHGQSREGHFNHFY